MYVDGAVNAVPDALSVARAMVADVVPVCRQGGAISVPVALLTAV